MSVEENKALIYKVYDEYNKENYDVYDECFADDFISIRHDGNTLDKESYKQFLIMIKTGFPDIHRTMEDIIVTEDRAALYFTWTGTDKFEFQGRTPTGKLIKVKEVYFIRFKDGKISEYRQYGDTHSMRYQLGALVDAEEIGK